MLNTGIYVIRNAQGLFYLNTKEGLVLRDYDLPYNGKANDPICFTEEEADYFCKIRIGFLFPELYSGLNVNNVYFNSNNTMVILGE